MPDWLVWVGVIFVTIVLVELVRLNLLLVSALNKELKLETLDESSAVESSTLVSVIIPAKDEGEVVAVAVRSVLASDYGNLQLIVVNDRSTDNTLEVMERLADDDRRITAVSVTELPEGWTGKTHALYQGALRASGELLLFTDADTVLDPAAISRAVHHLRVHQADMLGMLPQFRERGFNENAVYPHLALGFSSMYPLPEVNDPQKDAALAAGSFILIGKEAYERIGTWKRFKDQVTEDVALSKAIKAEGMKLNVVRGGRMVQTRPFARLVDVQRFWKRTFYGGLEKSVPKILRVTMNYIVLTVLFAFFLLGLALVCFAPTERAHVALLALSAAAMAAVVVPYGFVVKQEEGSWWYGLTAPLGIIISAWVAGSALLAAISGRGIRWRGSVYR